MTLYVEQLERRDMPGGYFAMDAVFSNDEISVGDTVELRVDVEDLRANPRGINGTSAFIAIDWDVFALDSTPVFNEAIQWSGWEIIINDPDYLIPLICNLSYLLKHIIHTSHPVFLIGDCAMGTEHAPLGASP